MVDLLIKTKELFAKHGPEFTTVAKILTRTLVPLAPQVIDMIELICDYINDKNQSNDYDSIQKKLDQLGKDQQCVLKVISAFENELSPVMEESVEHIKLNENVDDLTLFIQTKLNQNHLDVKNEFQTISHQLQSLENAIDKLVEQQVFYNQGREQLNEYYKQALLNSSKQVSKYKQEGIHPDQVISLEVEHGKFQNAFLTKNIQHAKDALSNMKAISPNGITYLMSKAAFLTLQKEYKQAEHIHTRIEQTQILNADQNAHMKQTLVYLEQNHSHTYDRSSHRYQKGDTFGSKSWKLIEPLGEGGMGSVWSARNKIGEFGAIKLLHVHLSGYENFVTLFEKEIKILKGIHHASVIDIQDWEFDQKSTCFYVMPLISGDTLAQFIDTKEISISEFNALALQLVDGIRACHQKEVIHKDIKPANIMIRSDGKPILIDFGVAYAKEIAPTNVKSLSLGYASLEQQRGDSPTPSFDLYALGCVFKECLQKLDMPDMWITKIEQLTSPFPKRRGNAEELYQWLIEINQKYHIQMGDQKYGPYTIEEVINQIKIRPNDVYILGKNDRCYAWTDIQAIKDIIPEISSYRTHTLDSVHTTQATIDVTQSTEQEDVSLGDSTISVNQNKPLMILNPQISTFISQSGANQDFVTSYQNGERELEELPLKLRGFVCTPLDQWRVQVKHKIKKRFFFKSKMIQGSASFTEVMIPYTPKDTPFCMMNAPVSRTLYSLIMHDQQLPDETDLYPMTEINWIDCLYFCNKLSKLLNLCPVYTIREKYIDVNHQADGYRLPYEKEWEWAARAQENFTYSGSNSFHEIGWSLENSSEQIQESKQKKPNAFGLYDLSGNVSEWCANAFNTPDFNHKIQMGVMRGGSYKHYEAYSRIEEHMKTDPKHKGLATGMRLVRSIIL